MTRQTQKDHELRAVRHLRSVLPDFPREAGIEQADDPLDVTLALPNRRRIGIEVTDFVRDPSPKGSRLDAHQSLTGRIATAAEEAYAGTDAQPLYVQVRFSRSLSCRVRDIPAYAHRMAAQVAEIAAVVDATHVVTPISDLPPGIESMIVRPIRVPRPQFAVSYTDSWEYVTPASVERILGENEPKVPFYRATCDEVWLLIHVDGLRMSGWAQPPQSAVLHVRKSAFDRIFFLYDASRLLRIVIASSDSQG